QALEIAGNDFDLTDSFDFKTLEIVRQFDPLLGPVAGTANELEQVLLNLLRNAIDANRDRHPGAPSQVRLEASEADGNLAIRVIDQGPGVSDEQMGKLFT
ncbi:ATP-binding protein, partial [Escherichia coli]